MPDNPLPADVDPQTGCILESQHVVSRKTLAAVGGAMGVGFGLLNATLPNFDFTLNLALLGRTVGSIAVIIVLHEAVHGAAGLVLGHKPTFGIKPLFVFTTFRHKSPRGHFILVALAPLIILDGVAVAFYATGNLRLFYPAFFM